jgi:hypothetical protein
MKKVIRLTESDLIKIVNKIIIEQNDQSGPYGAIDKYKERAIDTGKSYKFQPVAQEMLPKYLQWYQGSTYPEIQEYITKTYGIPRLFDPKSLETADRTNKAYNEFREFLTAVKYALVAARNEGLNGYMFNKNYDFTKLSGVKGVEGRKLDGNWISILEDIPIIGELPKFKEFASKVITSRRNAIGLKA